MEYTIGMDIGTGSAKAVALDNLGMVHCTAQVHYGMLDTQHGYSEQDPEIVCDAFFKCIRQILAEIGQVPLCVSLSSAMHSLIVVDDNHLPLTNLISWADTRSQKIAEEIRNSEKAKVIYRQTGTPIHSMSPLCKIIWLKRNASDIFLKGHKFISIKEYIWFKLFETYQVDQSVATGTGLFNIEELRWNENSLQLCGIDDKQLSEVVSTGYIRSVENTGIASGLQLPANIKFCIGASDGCLANLGSFALDKTTAAVTIGTSGAVRVAATFPVFNFETMIFNYILDEQTFICGGPVNNGGNVLRWLIKSFLNIPAPDENDYQEVFRKIDTVPAGCNGLIFMPYLHGERAPIWDEQASGVFIGIKSYHQQAHFLRAGLEGVSFVLKSILQVIEQTTGSIRQLNVSGGFTHSKSWVQILADVTGKKVCLIQTEDASAVGAAMLSIKALKVIENFSSLRSDEGTIISPLKENSAMYEKYFSVFKDLYPILKDTLHRIAIVEK